MGGPGSGCHFHYWRPERRTVVEDCLALDANRLMRAGVLRAGVHQSGQLTWVNGKGKGKNPSVNYECCTTDPSAPWLLLRYVLQATGEEITCRIRLTTTRPHLGGLRWWFSCPLVPEGQKCGRRVGKLYLPPGRSQFGCRQCHNLTYASCQDGDKWTRSSNSIA